MIGRTISHYKIVAKLGEGGMGVVYKAEDTVLQRPVALKFLPARLASDPVAKQRFINEARAASALNHPNICTIYAVEDAGDRPFIAMEFVDGQMLSQIISGAPLAISNILAIAGQIAEGLNKAHSKNITHRDLKPDNVMVTAEGLVKVMDFGLAKMKNQSKLTKSGSTMGTAAYMSPEQAQAREVDQRSDIFSFGAVLYEMTTGQRAFGGDYEAAIAYAIVNENPPPPTEIRQDTPLELERIVFKCLEKEREDRYQSTELLLIDLKKLSKNIEAGRSTTKAVQPPVKTRKSIPKSILIAAGMVLTVAILVISYGLFQKEISAPKIVEARDLTSTAVAQEVDPKISPDGTKVVYASNEEGKGDIWVRQIATGQTMNLTKDDEAATRCYAWSPDGNWIAYVSARDGGGIYVISEYGGAARRVVAHSFEDLGRLNWSPDGKKLVYIVKRELYTVLANGGVPEHIPLPHEARDPAWSPDGERIVLILGSYFTLAKSSLLPSFRSRICTIRPDGSDAIAVFDEPGLLYSPTWANDGRRIFFKYTPAGTRDIWWVPVEANGKPTGSARRLTAGLNTLDFSLSSDGSRLTYSTGGNNFNVWSLPLAADQVLTMNDAVRITDENRSIYELTMSPDYDRFAFRMSSGKGSPIWLVRKDGRELRQLTTDSSSVQWFPS